MSLLINDSFQNCLETYPYPKFKDTKLISPKRYLTLPEDSFLAKAGIKQIRYIKDASKTMREGKLVNENSIRLVGKNNNVVAVGFEKVRELVNAIRQFGLKL